jgi:hypothetical protein
MNDGSLPKNWSLVNLSDVGTFESGGTPSKKTAIFGMEIFLLLQGPTLQSFMLAQKMHGHS